MEPSNVLVCCPNGHQLQAAVTDLSQSLFCPICGVAFAPAAGPQFRAGGLVYPPPTLGHAGYPTPTPPLVRPTYVGWLIGLQIAAMVVAVGIRLIGVAAGADPSQPQPLGMAGGCFMLVLIIPLAVLHLMWIYRIHRDAQQARGYAAVSPGLALGLCFVPVFNCVWPPWTLKRLMEFVTGAGGMTIDPGVMPALRLARNCFYMSIISAVVLCGSMAIGFVIGVSAGLNSASRGGPPGIGLLQEHPGLLLTDLGATLVYLAFMILYITTVRRVTKALYDFLGAPA
jgi:hypothetical protein